MERSMRDSDEFDQWLMAAQNPRPQPHSTATSHQQPPPTTATVGMAGHFNGNGGFLDAYSFYNRQLPAIGTVNPIRSIFEYRDRFPADFSPYDYSLNSYGGNFQRERNLEIDFGRLSLSSSSSASPNHHLQPSFLPSPLPARNNSLYDSSLINIGNVYPLPHARVPAPAPTFNRNNNNNNLFHDHRYNRRESFQLNQRGSSNNFLDQNTRRSYVNPSSINNNSNHHVVQPRTRSRFPESLDDIKGLIIFVAKDQEGCQFLQTKCEEGNPQDIEMIFNEIKDHIHQLMVDASANYLAQKLFKVCNERQMTHIVFSLITDDSKLTNICFNSHGTRAMQKLIELVTTVEQRSLIVSALRRITITLSRNPNGHHVIQYCVKSFHVDEVQPILDVVADNCMEIATDKSGCCVLQQCLLHADGICKERIMSDIIRNALHLSEHPYGNYVVQHLIGMQIPDATSDIIQILSGNFISLSMNKYGSNVVEKCLKDATDDQSIHIIREFINSPHFLPVMQHPFGNYVAQSIMRAAKGPIRDILLKKVQKEYPFINSHPHGKRVLVEAQIMSKHRVSIHA